MVRNLNGRESRAKKRWSINRMMPQFNAVFFRLSALDARLFEVILSESAGVNDNVAARLARRMV
jgi:hypothetical protein